MDRCGVDERHLLGERIVAADQRAPLVAGGDRGQPASDRQDPLEPCRGLVAGVGDGHPAGHRVAFAVHHAGTFDVEVGQAVALQAEPAGDRGRLHPGEGGELALRHQLPGGALDLPLAVAGQPVLADHRVVDVDAVDTTSRDRWRCRSRPARSTSSSVCAVRPSGRQAGTALIAASTEAWWRRSKSSAIASSSAMTASRSVSA